MYKKVIYRDRRDGGRKIEWFEVKGSINKKGITVDKHSEIDSIKFMSQDHVEYLGSYYKTIKEE
jgi:hypothetical protein